MLANLAALDYQVRSTVELTSQGRIARSEEALTPQILMTQNIANQVTIMQALRDLIVLMVAPEEMPDEEPPDKPPAA